MKASKIDKYLSLELVNNIIPSGNRVITTRLIELVTNIPHIYFFSFKLTRYSPMRIYQSLMGDVYESL